MTSQTKGTGTLDPPIPTILDDLETKLNKDTLVATSIQNVREATTYVDLLYRSLCSSPSFPITCEIDGLGKEVDGARKTYLKLCEEAVAVADSLTKEGVEEGDRVALLFLGSTDIFAAFYGCMLAGIIPIVLPPPIKMASDLPNFNAVVKQVGVKYVLSHNLYYQHSSIQTVSHRFSSLLKAEAASWPSHLKWFYIENVTKPTSFFSSFSSSNSSTTSYDRLKERFLSYSQKIKPNNIAYLQLTSGSTSHPKAVIVPHSSLVLSVLKLLMIPFSSSLPMYYETQINHTSYTSSTFSSLTSSVNPLAEDEEGRSVLVWVPAYHDFYWGLWGAAQLTGYTFVIMSPLDFLGRPASWLESCYRYRSRFVGEGKGG